MKRFSSILASVPFAVTSIPALAADLQFNVPVTDRAAQSAELLARAAYAVDDSARGQSLSNLWVFPTHDAGAVFARYTLTSAGAVSTEHLAVVEQQADGTFRVKDLTEAGRSTPHWSASI